MIFMKIKFIIIALSFALLMLPQLSGAGSLQVGVSPARIDMGELEPGSVNYGSFSLVTESGDEILVRLGALSGSRDVFMRPEYIQFANISSDYDVRGWVSFPANPVVIKPQNRTLETLGGGISGWRGAGFTVSVPADAEPCYYAFQIQPMPYTNAAYDTGVNIAALTLVSVVFRVPGNCLRTGSIIDIRDGGGPGGNIALNTYFRNTGSATISAQVSEMRAYGGNSTILAAAHSGAKPIAPGQIGVLSSYFNFGALEAGKSYNITSTVSWGSGSDTKSALLTLEYKKPAETITPPPAADWRAYLPRATTLIIIIIIIAAAYFIYKREE